MTSAVENHLNVCQRETQTIDFVHNTFPDARKILSRHQAPRKVKIRKRIKGLLKGNLEHLHLHTPVALSGYARSRGFEIFHSGDAEDFLNLYLDVAGTSSEGTEHRPVCSADI
jgi:hypothetical protein